eukprot:CAMPEP_0184861294 /NCGR_PEP_ID=MMETSP0580-20130426/6008_1 /TAXON_ID=1118495 /ORGANISM="Dactyliosolen fragilissimus" /LENGTH=234 /DNA_ID=CAMNT_0027358723 /DNA_START=140 /DNA_END=844 /DNA_ORIENTATION=+
MLAPHTEECLVVRVPGGEDHHLTGSYDMLNDDLSADPVTAVLFDKDWKVVWHSAPGNSEGSFSAMGSGRFELCFGNGYGPYETDEGTELQHPHMDHHIDDDKFDYDNKDDEPRKMGFSFRVTPLDGTYKKKEQEDNTKTDITSTGTTNKDGKKVSADQQKDALMQISSDLMDKMNLLQDHNQYIKERESMHRDVIEQTFSMILSWTLLEALVLVIVSITQVMYLKKFFETKRYL